jgi:hypothetical protein
MKKGMFLMVLVALLVAPEVSYGETKEKCEVNCTDRCGTYNKNDTDFNNCMGICMAECLPGKPTSSSNSPTMLKADLDSSMPSALSSSENYQGTGEGTFLIALGEKLCCYDKGRLVGRCHELTPYFNVLNGECFATREDCKENAGGYDFCFTCGSKC